MVGYRRIMFPLDLSPAAPAVARHVATMAAKFAAEVHVVYVVPFYEGPTFASYERVMDEIKQTATQTMDEFTAKHLQEVKQLKTRVLVGHTGRQLLDYAAQNDISLIIMGTHGRSGVGRLFFGSVAQRVVQSSPVPVMTVHPV